MKNYIYPLLILLFCNSLLFGQSLINNGSFEEFSRCPKRNGQLNRAKKWRNPLKTTPDYFHACANKSFSSRIPENWSGIQIPKSGEAHLGLILQVYRPSKDTTFISGYKELAQTKLNRKLKKGELLCVEFYISQAEISEFSVDRVPVIFTEDKHLYKVVDRQNGFKRYGLSGYQISCTNSDTFLTDKENWTKICGVYKATGNEQFLTIGTMKNLLFQKNVMPKRRKYRKQSTSSYYYIDDVSLYPIADSSECQCGRKQTITPNRVEIIDTIKNSTIEIIDTPTNVIENTIISIETPMILKNIQFEFNSANLINQKLENLDKLALYLIENNTVIVEIGGHTDNVGEEKYNLELSQKRAESIQQYLMKKGVAIHQLEAKGYGETQSIDDNSTRQGRKNNRRVEIKIIQD